MQRILMDEDFWNNNMLPMLRNFYLQAMLRELVDSRIARRLRVQEPLVEIENAIGLSFE